MTVPTKLTIIRLVLTGVVMALLFFPGWPAKALALAAFLLASFSDWLDGFLARRWRQTTALGALLDPIADKVLVLGVLLAFVQLRLVPAWMVLVIVAREFLITGVRLVAAGRGIVLAAEAQGKQKAASQMATIVLILATLLVRELAPGSAAATRLGVVIPIALWITVTLTILSGASLLWTHRAALTKPQ